MSRVDLRIDGTSCRNCVISVQRALSALDGVEVNRVQACSAHVQFESGAIGVDEIRLLLRDEGFSVRDVWREGAVS